MKPHWLLLPVCLLFAACATTTPPTKSTKPSSKAYQLGEVIPDMTGRRPELVPGALPARVRYHFSSNETVNTMADRLVQALTTDDDTLTSDVTLVNPGAWTVLKHRNTIGKKDAGELRIFDPTEGITLGSNSGRAGKFLRNRAEAAILVHELRVLLAEHDGFDLRALTTMEMLKWCVYIGFDIEEPVYVAATRDGGYKFVIVLSSKHQIFIVDELNSLPDAY